MLKRKKTKQERATIKYAERCGAERNHREMKRGKNFSKGTCLRIKNKLYRVEDNEQVLDVEYTVV